MLDEKKTKKELLNELAEIRRRFAELEELERRRMKSDELATNLGRILEESLNEIYIFDTETLRFVLVNKGARTNLGYSTEELSSLTPLDINPVCTLKSFRELIKPLQTKEREKIEFVTVHRRKDGSLYPVEVHLQISTFNDSPVFVAIILDITKRKLAEERFQLVVEASPNAIVMVDQEGKIKLVNTQTEKLFGYSRGELIGQSVEILVPRRFRDRHFEYRKSFFTNPEARPMGRGRDLFAVRKDGSECPVEIGLSPIKLSEGLMVLSSMVDITERKRAEQVLRESEEKLQAIMDNIPDAVLVYDEQGKIITINKEASRLFCAKGKKKLENIWDIIPTEDKDKFTEKLKRVKQGNNLLDHEMEKIQKNGDRISVSVAISYMQSESGMFFETIRDIRERVVLRNKIVELEKAQVVGKMAEGLAHHMGTPLASMLLRVQMLKEDIQSVENYPSMMEKLESIERQIFYGQKVMQRLLKFASKPEKEKRPEKISSIIGESVEIIKPLLNKPGIKLELPIGNDLWVLADVDLLELLFSDIIMNAIDAMPKGGKISLNISISNWAQKDIAEITVSDTGTGIPEEVLPRVFEPFFSTKPAGKGTGLGLSVAKRIIQDHGGEISLESTEGEGTSVYIKIPIYS
ncbi:PAS domain S-box protein, partial [Desulfobacterota bacterium AH_259_B03_O07]|nr:PAS domain S-box protein [Desulfobacterota bacterium AH_259_B03_O07]